MNYLLRINYTYIGLSWFGSSISGNTRHGVMPNGNSSGELTDMFQTYLKGTANTLVPSP